MIFRLAVAAARMERFQCVLAGQSMQPYVIIVINRTLALNDRLGALHECKLKKLL